MARRTAEGIELRVHPTLIPADRLIANVNGVMNAVMVNGDAAGSTLYYGAGAGMEPTASSVVGDVVDVVRAMTSDPENRVPHLAFQPDSLSAHPILPIEACESAYYLRIQAKDHPGYWPGGQHPLGAWHQHRVDHAEGSRGTGRPGADDPADPSRGRAAHQRRHRRPEALQDVVGKVVRIRVEQLN